MTKHLNLLTIRRYPGIFGETKLLPFGYNLNTIPPITFKKSYQHTNVFEYFPFATYFNII